MVEAACSHYRLLQQEAARQQAEAARREAEAYPSDPQHRAAAEQAEAVAATAAERQAAKVAQSKPSGRLRVRPIEPEARVQPLKRGRGKAPSCRPSVLANEQRIVVALDVHASSETAQLAELLDQSQRITGAPRGAAARCRLLRRRRDRRDARTRYQPAVPTRAPARPVAPQ